MLETSLIESNSLKYIGKPLFIDFLNKINKTNIKYFASSGTLLGAIRHGGIIPWDTDIDIGITLENAKELVEWINRNDEYYIVSNFNGEKLVYKNRIKTYDELLLKQHSANIYITSNMHYEHKDYLYDRTCCELELFYYSETENPEFNSDKNSKFYFYCSDVFKHELCGKMNIPSHIIPNLKRVPYYDTIIQIFDKSEEYCKCRFGENCLTHMPNTTNRKTTSFIPITDFSPL